MERYRRFLVDGGNIHLKTDSNFLYTYTRYMVEKNHLPVECSTEDLYNCQLSSVNSPLDPKGRFPQKELKEAASIQTY